MLAHASPEPRSMGLRKNFREIVYEVMGFRDFSFSDQPVIPSSHLIGVKVFDSNVENGRLVIPIQNLERLEPNSGDWVAYHTIDGLASPLKIDLIRNEGNKNIYGYGKKQTFLLRHYTPEGKFSGFVPILAVNDNPAREEVHPGNQIHLHVTTRQSRWTFMTGEKLRQGLTVTKRIQEERNEEANEFRKSMVIRRRMVESEVEAAFSAAKPVGQIVCTRDGWIGVVEQNESDRIKMSVIGRSGIRGDFPFSRTAASNLALRFDIDTTLEGKIHWMDSSDLGVCDYEIDRG
jgi:hypothetical protein